MRIGMKRGMTRLVFAMLGIFLLSCAAVTEASTVQYRYDELDRLYQVEYEDGTVVEYAYDNVGNRIAQRIVDNTAPVTTATPPGGQYGSGLTVSLNCSDGPEGSGCDRIYYTLDGTIPTAASPVYSAPLPLADGGTTLRYFAVDRAGNAETVKTQNYNVGTRTIAASAGACGSITPSGNVIVNYGASQTFAIAPNAGCAISNVVVDNTSQGAISTYTFNNVTTNHTISASFVYTAVTVLSPNGGEVIPSGGSYTIRWGAPSAAVKFNLSYTLNGSSYTTIANGVTGTSYNWTVPKPSANSPLCKIRVIGLNGSNQTVGTDFSDGNFTIEVVRLTAPNGGGGQTLRIGTIVPITWVTNGTSKTVNKVKLSYSTNGGSSWTAIATVTGNPGTYNWTVPSSPSGTCRAKVELFNNNTAVGNDASDQNFSIAP